MTFLLAFWKPIAIGLAVVALVAVLGIAKHNYDNKYIAIGAARVQTEWDASKLAAKVANDAQEGRWQRESEARQKAEQERDDERSKRTALAASAARNLPVAVARIRVPAAARRVLDDAIDAGNSTKITEPSPKPVEATPAAAESADSTIGQLTEWGVACIAAYDEARGMVTGWQDFYAGLQKAQP